MANAHFLFKSIFLYNLSIYLSICLSIYLSIYLFIQVRVLFTHPCFNSMKPCSYFLEGRCKFSETTCKYSHGHVVFFDQLKPFSEPDYRYVGTSVKHVHLDYLSVAVVWSLVICADIEFYLESWNKPITDSYPILHLPSSISFLQWKWAFSLCLL